MSKMALHGPFGHLQHKLWQKEGPGVKLAIWLPTTKSRESTRPRCMQVECDTPLESSQGGLQVFFRPYLNQRSEQKLWPHKVLRVQTEIVLRLLLGSHETKNHLDGVPRRGTKYTIWRKVVASPEFGSWWIKWI